MTSISKKTALFTAKLRNLKIETETVRNYLREWSEVTAWHCVNNVQRSTVLWRRTLWLALVILSGYLAINQITMLILEFRDDGRWVTSISYEIPDDAALDWPNVSVCHLNEFFRSLLKADNKTDPYEIAYVDDLQMEGIEFYKTYQEMRSNGEQDMNTTLARARDRYSEMFINNNLSVTELLRRYVKKCNDTVLHCGTSETFSLHDKSAHCCDSSEKLRWRSCFSMHPTKVFGKSYRSASAGGFEYAGLYYLLNPNVTDYYEHLTLNSKPIAGYYFQLYYGTLEETTPATVMLAPGVYGLVSLVPIRHTTVPQHHSLLPWVKSDQDCAPKTYHFIDSENYSHQLCKMDCWITWEMHECGCTTQTVRLKQNEECVGQAITKCHSAGRYAEKLMSQYEDGFSLANCRIQCKESCEYRTVEAKISQSLFPAPPKVKAFTTYLNRAFPSAGPFSEEDAKQLIMFEMYYETLEYRVITKTEKSTFGQLISNIGGALGVWTGLSLLSIVQAIVYLTNCLSKMISDCDRRSSFDTKV